MAASGGLTSANWTVWMAAQVKRHKFALLHIQYPIEANR